MEQVKARLWQYKVKAGNRPLISWVGIDSGVNLVLVPDLRERYIPDGDAIFATAYETAFPVSTFSSNKGRKIYLIQSYETWSGKECNVKASWTLPFHKIVISRHLLKQATELGEAWRTSYIPIGLDLSVFKCVKPLSERARRIGMLAHPNKAKGLKDGIRALQIVKEKMPNVQAAVFGTEPRSPELPNWVEYTQRPSPQQLVELYNSCQIFLNPSWTEGWGLPAAEAMACGCALVSADNGGVNEFAVDEENALIVPIQRPDLLAEKLQRLLTNDALRFNIALSGNQNIQKFAWDHAVDLMEQVIFQQVGK
jgi:glycosyltransferase involved in cell wall biosynthesis